MNTDYLLKIYSIMQLSRCFDEYCMERLAAGAPMPHFHSGVGQEALAVTPVVQLKASDQLLYTHRGVGQLLAKGVPLKSIVLDQFDREGGTNNGFGGILHVADRELGVPGREGIFGSRFGISVGLALAAKLRERSDVVLCFYGEAAGSRGNLYESMNMAVLWSLPIVFIAENNGWSFSSRTEWLYPDGRMSTVWRGFGIPVEVVDGNDVIAVDDAVSRAIEHARGGQGPSVVEGLTYRIDPHLEWDDAAYQPAEEIERWRRDDPLARTERRLRDMGVAEAQVAAIETGCRQEVDAAFAALDAAKPATWGETVLERTE